MSTAYQVHKVAVPAGGAVASTTAMLSTLKVTIFPLHWEAYNAAAITPLLELVPLLQWNKSVAALIKEN